MRRSTCTIHLVPSTAGRRIAIATFIALALIGVAVNAMAQSAIQVRGLVDLVGTDVGDYRYLNTNNTNDGNFDALRARLFVDGRRNNTSVYLQFLISPDGYSDFRFFGGYVMQRVHEERNIYLEAGLIPVNDGIWAAITYSNENPLIGIPLMQYWKGGLTATQMPNSLDDLLSKRGQAQEYGVTYADSNGVRGYRYAAMPILYDNCWNYGAYALGTLGRFEFALGATLGAPSASVQGTDSNDNISPHFKLGYAFTPGLKMWASIARGAYLDRAVAPYLPAGATVNDYYQDLYGLSADWKVWRFWFMGEYFYNHYDTPIRESGLSNQSYYVQSVFSLAPAWDLAIRYDAMRFEDVQDSAGNTMTWDLNVQRWESGVDYHVSRDLVVKGVAQMTQYDGDWDMIPAIQASFGF
jgi:hypothetical protein